MEFINYYKVLGVPKTASESEIKTAYRKLSKKFHPDVNAGDPYFEERFKEIQEAYETLGNPGRRTAYDQKTSPQPQTGRSSKSEENFDTSKSTQKGPVWEEVYEEKKQTTSSYGAYTRANTSYSRSRTKKKQIPPFAARLMAGSILLFIIWLLSPSRQSDSAPVKENPTWVADIAKDSAHAIVDSTAHAIVDRTLVKVDSTVYAARDTSLSQTELSAEILPGIMLRVDNKLIPAIDYAKQADTLYLHMNKEYATDLDQDGRPEIVTLHWTGGAHCCDINQIFNNESDHVYKEVFRFTGDLTISGNELKCNFYESIGYFNSCYACSVENLFDDKYYSPALYLRYDSGKIKPGPVNILRNMEITADLELLSKRPVPPLREDGMDDGTRKAYAGRILAFIFNIGDVSKGKDLFDTYYFGMDKEVVWKDISESLKYILNEQLVIERSNY